MDTKVITFSIFLLVFCKSVTAEELIKYSAKDYFKNYALSSCIADGFKSNDARSDAAAAASGYLELGEYPLEAHTEATILGREFLKKPYKSISGADLILMKCIDFYHSKELESIATKYQNAK
ncbi:type VI secretion protein [Cellvibrio sp. KY-GH-1]|uniref:T6SS amidase immunity protein Tai4 family protein n=1 Tax=Cellvibrio sp. KY-GH-1 TaxID=2303332 RepID=UPI001248EA3B|nr:T6SS amidase immunity protein Tai4 family protein [Cellvibrio sp. KY-GH-1]QEY16738.1 type VI secretion protein [Cellvibrio sp. KY-GH-1]